MNLSFPFGAVLAFVLAVPVSRAGVAIPLAPPAYPTSQAYQVYVNERA